MDFNTRLKALSRLTESKTEAAARHLQSEFEIAARTLREGSDYDQLQQAIAIVDAIGARFPSETVSSLIEFISAIDSRPITYSDLVRGFGGAFQKYRNAESLNVRAQAVLIRFRYYDAPEVLRLLISLACHQAESVRRKAVEGLHSLAQFDLGVFYGKQDQEGIGPTPQLQVVEVLEGYPESHVQKIFAIFILVLEDLLSAEMKGAEWSYDSVTLSRAAIPTLDAIEELRRRAIELLKRAYAAARSSAERLRVVTALTSATRAEPRGNVPEASRNMFIRDALDVLAFFTKVAASGDLQVVEKAEHNAYWIFYHAISPKVELAALAVEQATEKNAEYKIYKVLIGFEGIFGDWKKLKENSKSLYSENEKFRRAKATEFAQSITDENFAIWRARILKYGETKSEDFATFPIFYYFLEQLAVAQPELAFKFVENDADQFENFLIPLLKALWRGPLKEKIRQKTEDWLQQGKHLFAATKQFLETPDLDISLLQRLLKRAAALNDFATVSEIVVVAVSNLQSDAEVVRELLMPSIKILSNGGDARWIHHLWYRKELKETFATFEVEDVRAILGSLLSLPSIGYQAEEILHAFATKHPQEVLAYLFARLDFRGSGKAAEDYEAVPHKLHKLNHSLSTIPVEAIETVRKRYDGDYAGLVYGAARLLHAIFGDFPKPFEEGLIELIQRGGECDWLVALAVLRNYEGQKFTHRVCKEIIRAVPENGIDWKELAICLENTGVVGGEFGLAEAYGRKALEEKEWLSDDDEKVQAFARWHVDKLTAMADGEMKSAEEQIALRKHQYN